MLVGILLLLSILGVSPVMAFTIVTVEQPQFTPVLKKSAAKVSFPLNQEDKQLIAWMKKKIIELGGVGLAAPQINVSKLIAVVYIPKEAGLLRDNVAEHPLQVLINPSYEPAENANIFYDFESCYSVSSKAGKVPRYDAINVRFYDEQGQLHQLQAKGFYARVLQHEIDHLQGILITDRLTKDCVQGSLQEMFELRRSELSPEKRALFDKIIEKKSKPND